MQHSSVAAVRVPGVALVPALFAAVAAAVCVLLLHLAAVPAVAAAPFAAVAAAVSVVVLHLAAAVAAAVFVILG